QKSAGMLGFHGTRKSNLFAAQQVAKSVFEIATKNYGAKQVMRQSSNKCRSWPGASGAPGPSR
ncbi:MAG: hypothetical protein Q8886_02800, partial [Candidatus Phytoplasma australasiaticum]|nr:hypothetical protein [Candidatus Phytoplasma australasiaticum]